MMQLNNQQGDVSLFQTINDGDITVVDGITEMSSGLETAAYLALFGGNEDDNGIGDNKLQWWGNIDENDKSKKYRSQTQYLLNKINATSSNLKRIEEAAKNDLSFFIDTNAASEINVSVSIPNLNKINISCTIMAEGEEKSFNFTENWKSER